MKFFPAQEGGSGASLVLGVVGWAMAFWWAFFFGCQEAGVLGCSWWLKHAPGCVSFGAWDLRFLDSWILGLLSAGLEYGKVDFKGEERETAKRRDFYCLILSTRPAVYCSKVRRGNGADQCLLLGAKALRSGGEECRSLR